ncbi:MAG: IS110 family transposase [Bryobacterales bacterium]|nr:IS110 family transposase [Bryobacterales bacterium]
MIEKIARNKYPETARLMQVSGVGTLIATSFVLTVEDPTRFGKSRDVGCYVGLRPKRKDSGEKQPELSITKEGDAHLRRMLVQGAHHILSHRGPDSDLKRLGLKLAGQGKKNAKKRAVVAVARTLAVLLRRLWMTGEKDEPLRTANREAARQAARAA